MRHVLLLLAALLSTGCATTLSTLQTADTTEVGQVQVTGGMGGFINVGPMASLIKQGIEQGAAIKRAQQNKEPYELSAEAQQDLLTAGIAIAVAPPTQAYELGVRTGIYKDADVGFRYSVNALRLDGKYRLLHRGDGADVKPHQRKSFDLAVGVAVSKYLFKNPVFDLLDYVRLGDFSRWDFEVPVIASVDVGEIFSLYGAAKWHYGRTEVDANLVNYSDQVTLATGVDLSLPPVVHAHFFGGTVGVRAGYRWVHVMLELTGGYLHSRPIIFGVKRDLGGPTFYPAVGIGLKFP